MALCTPHLVLSAVFLLCKLKERENYYKFTIDVETRGTGDMCPQDFEINKEVPSKFLENAPFFLRKRCPRSVVPPKFEMLPTSLNLGSAEICNLGYASFFVT